MKFNHVRIGDLFAIEKGNVQSSKNIPGNYDFITAGAEWKTHNEFSHDCEALIFAMGASGSLGRTHYVNGKFIASDLCFILTPKAEYRERIDLKFYYSYFNVIRDEIVRHTATGTSKLAINIRNFSNYKIVLPSIEEQKQARFTFERIQPKVTFLSEVVEESLNDISYLRQSILQEAVQGKLVPQNPNDEPASDLLEKIYNEKKKLAKDKKINKVKPAPIADDVIPYELPLGWKWVRFGEICKNVDYGTSTKASSENIGVPVLRMNNVINGKIDFTDLKYVEETINDLPKLYLEAGDLLFNRTNSYELVGKTGIFTEPAMRCTFASYLIRCSIFLDFLNAKYVNYYMNSAIFRKTQLEPQITQQNGQANFNGSKLKETLVPIPPLREQSRIVEKVEQIMALCDELEKTVQQSKHDSEMLMQSVILEAFNRAERKESIIEYPSVEPIDFEDWEIAARSGGEIDSQTKVKIKNRVAELLGES